MLPATGKMSVTLVVGIYFYENKEMQVPTFCFTRGPFLFFKYIPVKIPIKYGPYLVWGFK